MPVVCHQHAIYCNGDDARQGGTFAQWRYRLPATVIHIALRPCEDADGGRMDGEEDIVQPHCIAVTAMCSPARQDTGQACIRMYLR